MPPVVEILPAISKFLSSTALGLSMVASGGVAADNTASHELSSSNALRPPQEEQRATELVGRFFEQSRNFSYNSNSHLTTSNNIDTFSKPKQNILSLDNSFDNHTTYLRGTFNSVTLDLNERFSLGVEARRRDPLIQQENGFIPENALKPYVGAQFNYKF